VILVTGASGKTGAAVVAALAAAGAPVRALVRRPVAVPGATETARGDLHDLTPHLDGVTAVYLVWPNFDAGELAGATAAIAACRAAGVGRLVYHSVLHPHVAAMPHHWAKAEVEGRLFESRVPFVSLQPAAYVQNIRVERVRAEGTYPSPWGLDVAQSLVDLHDVAEVAARACFDDALLGGCYELVGPEPLTAPQIATTLGEVLSRPVEAVDVGSAGWAKEAVESGTSPYAVDCGVRMADHYRAHGFTGSPLVLAALLGHAPTGLRAALTRAAR
jgi:uncharacterized protein YbjT (DUF2867 family)